MSGDRPSTEGSTAAVAPTETVQALIFDCDGTLVDTASAHYQAWAAALAAAGAELPERWYRERVGLSRGDLLREARETFAVVFNDEAVSAEAARHYGAALPSVRPLKHVVDVARAAHGRVPLAVASGGQRQLVVATLAVVGLLPLFDVVVTIEDVTINGIARGKPAPDLFLEAARRLDVPPPNCVVYEDSAEGIAAARHAGMRAVDVRVLTGSVDT